MTARPVEPQTTAGRRLLFLDPEAEGYILAIEQEAGDRGRREALGEAIEAVAGLTVLRLTGEQLAEVESADASDYDSNAGTFAVDWDEFDEFLHWGGVTAVLQALRDAEGGQSETTMATAFREARQLADQHREGEEPDACHCGFWSRMWHPEPCPTCGTKDCRCWCHDG